LSSAPSLSLYPRHSGAIRSGDLTCDTTKQLHQPRSFIIDSAAVCLTLLSRVLWTACRFPRFWGFCSNIILTCPHVHPVAVTAAAATTCPSSARGWPGRARRRMRDRRFPPSRYRVDSGRYRVHLSATQAPERSLQWSSGEFATLFFGG
jgi:hypothetical protein